jgi:hypothetical protein
MRLREQHKAFFPFFRSFAPTIAILGGRSIGILDKYIVWRGLLGLSRAALP